MSLDLKKYPETLQAFVSALYEAHDASESVDAWDLRDDDPSSVQRFQELVEAQSQAFRALHEVCHRVPVEHLVDAGDKL